MKVKSIRKVKSNHGVKVMDCFVGEGYLQGQGGQLPDVDIDFQADRRQEIKEYIERRYNHDGKQRVFSAGTFTTLKLKAVLKDVARVHRVPVGTVNYITAIFEDDKMDWTDLFKLAAVNKKVRSFIMSYPQVIEDIRTLMGQPRSSSVHASALLVTPDMKDGEDMECFDFTPIKKMDGMLVSEFDGYSLDDQGLLKNDCLGIKELSKIQEVIDICNRQYNAGLAFQQIAQSDMNDEKVYELLRKGYTQNVFQFSSKGITKFLMEMQPTCIHDLIAANALYRPASLESSSTKKYVDRKRGDAETVYLWGTYEAMRDTYGVLCYQEQLAQIAREVGGFSLGDGVKLVKYISKKKQDKINAQKDKFLKGAKANGCPTDDALAIWEMFEVAGGYLFNRSHATAYAITAYIGAYLKANYPTAFYTVALEWADDDQIAALMSEMQMCSVAKIVPPDINVSGMSFYTDYRTNSIFWSVSKIRMLGAKATDYIIAEREARGEFTSIGNFIDRIFKYKLKKYEYWDDADNPDEATRCPVNARHIRNLILAGCFDKVESILTVTARYAILLRAANKLGFELDEKEFPKEMRDKHYFWQQLQISVSGVGSIDYKRVYDFSSIKPQTRVRAPYVTLDKITDEKYDGKLVTVCATISEIEERKFQDKKTGQDRVFAKLHLVQNNDMVDLLIWEEELSWTRHMFTDGGDIQNAKNKIIVALALVRHSDYSGKNELQLYRNSLIEVI